MELSKNALKGIAGASGDLCTGKLFINNKSANEELTRKFPLCSSGNTHWLEDLKVRITYNSVCQKWEVGTC